MSFRLLLFCFAILRWDQSLQALVSGEQLAALEGFSCKGCNRTDTCTKYDEYSSAPEVLVVPLSRFHQDCRDVWIKNETPISFDEDLSLLEGQVRYKLVSVIDHSGASKDGGHYTATCRHPRTDRWYEYNDADRGVVKPVRSPAGRSSSTATIFFYIKEA